MITRRQLVAGAASFSVAGQLAHASAQTSTPEASPIATPVTGAPTTDMVLQDWLDAQEQLRSLGSAATEAFWSQDADALLSISTPDVAAAIQSGLDVDRLTDLYNGNQVHFAFPEAGGWFFGKYSPDTIEGVFTQGGALEWTATPDDPQTSDFPTGTWTGIIGPGAIDLGIRLVFAGDAENLEVLLSIPSQFLVNHPMSSVTFIHDLEIGEQVDTRVVPAGGEVTFINNYAELYSWGANSLVLDTWWTGEGELAGLSLLPQGALAELEPQEPVVARLPFDGAWLVVWGGDTVFRNYHAEVAQQRYAVDILLWQDGSTTLPPGEVNEQYHAFGQPYLAPVDGTVVTVLDGLEDIAPQTAGNPGDHPAGNHIVIETNGVFVFLAHCQQGSVLVREGDTVRAGDVVASVGNSGNTSEPHVHIHAQTHAELFDPSAVGVPIVFDQVLENGVLQEQLSPVNGTIVEQLTL